MLIIHWRIKVMMKFCNFSILPFLATWFLWDLFKQTLPLEIVSHALAVRSHGDQVWHTDRQDRRMRSVERRQAGKKRGVILLRDLKPALCVSQHDGEQWLDTLCIFQIADSRDDFRRFDSSGTNPTFSAAVTNLRTPVSQKVSDVFFQKKWDKGGLLCSWFHKSSFDVNH